MSSSVIASNTLANIESPEIIAAWVPRGPIESVKSSSLLEVLVYDWP